MSEIKKLNTDLASEDISTLVFHLANDRLYLPDVLRDYRTLMDSLATTFEFSPKPFGIYIDEKLVGVVLMRDIIPEHEARLLMWMWDKKAVTHKTLRWMGQYLDYMGKEYGLKRIVAQSSDNNLGRLLERLGFKNEARMKYGMKWGGKLHTLMQFRKIVE